MPDRGLLLSTLLVGLAARGHSVAAEAPSESGFIRVAAAHSAFHGDYSHEANLAEERLGPGIKILDSKIGVRATRFCIPSFVLALDRPAAEENGEAHGGSLEWSGSFQLAFEVDWNNRLRALCGINPFGSQYRLQPRTTFATPAMLWTWSGQGKA
jgi:alpha-galactosidase